MIRPAVATDLVALQEVERRADRRFAEVADPRIAACAHHPPMDLDELRGYLAAGRLAVAVDDDQDVARIDETRTDVDRPVGMVAYEVLGGRGHVEEVSVDPSAQGAGHGTALLAVVHAWADEAGLDGVTLTTFRDVPWNRPFYERRGYRVLADHELSRELDARLEAEARHGLDRDLRVAMWRPGTDR